MGSISTVIYVNSQLMSSYTSSVRAYYLAITGVNYARQISYAEDRSLGGTYAPVPQANIETILSFINKNDITVTRKSFGDIPDLNSNITSVGKDGTAQTTLMCQSGDDVFTIDTYIGMLMPTDKNGFHEYQIPIVKWRT